MTKYLNDIVLLAGLILLGAGVNQLYGWAVACILMGCFCVGLALFKPLIEILRGSNAANAITDTESAS